MRRLGFFVLMILSFNLWAVSKGQIDNQTQSLATSLLANQQLFSDSKEGVEAYAAKELKSYQDVKQGGADDESKAKIAQYQALQKHYDANLDRRDKSVLDPISVQLKGELQAASSKGREAVNKEFVANVHDRKNNFKIQPDDRVFQGYHALEKGDDSDAKGALIAANGIGSGSKPQFGTRLKKDVKVGEPLTVTCHESAIPKEFRCHKRRQVSLYQPANIKKVITVYSGAYSYAGHTTYINLKTGAVTTNTTAHAYNRVENSLDSIAPGGELVSIKYLGRRLWSEIGAHSIEIYMDEPIGQPTKANGLNYQLTIHQGGLGSKKNRKRNGNKWRGLVLRWEVEVKPKAEIKEEWIDEDCSKLERLSLEGVCALASEPINVEVGKSVHLPGYSDPITRSHWGEEFIYQCGGLKNIKNECVAFEEQGCEQIDSKVHLEKEGIPIEYRQTFICGNSGYQPVNQIPEIDETSLIPDAPPEGFDGFDEAEFAETMGDFQVLKEMNASMKDGLGGIGLDDPENPSVFHGKCKRCAIRGAGLQNCCDLKGLLQNIIAGGCSDDERDLAHAALKDKRCHQVGDRYCSKRVSVGVKKVCISEKRSYCCYGSQLAKIVHEIAKDDPSQTKLRQYNQANGLPQGWGAPAKPHCQSLTVEQLRLIDFRTPYAKQHLSQLMGEFSEKAKDKIARMIDKSESSDGLEAKAKRAKKDLIAHYQANQDKYVSDPLLGKPYPKPKDE